MLDTNNLGLVIVDMQEICLTNLRTETKKSLVDAFCEFLNSTRKLNLPTAIFEILPASYFRTRSKSPTVPEVITQVSKNYNLFEKFCENGFENENSGIFFREKKVKTILITGVYTDLCIMDNAIGARREGFGIVGCKNLMATRGNCSKDIIERTYNYFREHGTLYEHHSEMFK